MTSQPVQGPASLCKRPGVSYRAPVPNLYRALPLCVRVLVYLTGAQSANLYRALPRCVRTMAHLTDAPVPQSVQGPASLCKGSSTSFRAPVPNLYRALSLCVRGLVYLTGPQSLTCTGPCLSEQGPCHIFQSPIPSIYTGPIFIPVCSNWFTT